MTESARAPSATSRLFYAAMLALTLVLLGLGATALALTQRVPLGQGAFSAPKGSWKAIAVPRGSILIDVFDADGSPGQTYGKAFSKVPPRRVRALGFRPGGLPSRHGLLAGAAGKRVRKVRIYLRGGARRTLRTVPAPADWGTPNRLFAFGFTVPARFRKALRVVTRVEGLNASGRRLTRLRRVRTGAY